MTVALETPVELRLAYKYLVSERLWDRLVRRIMRDESVAREIAERIMNEALGFLVVCAKNPSRAFGPSRMVDIGWHTFLWFSRDYMEFCQRIAGGYIHHEPSDEEGASGGVSLLETIEALRQVGPVDEMLWARDGGDCLNTGGCSYCGSTCVDTIASSSRCGGTVTDCGAVIAS